MKKLSKIVLVVFSVIILIIGVVINLLAIGWLDFNTAFTMIEKFLTTSPQSNIILIVNGSFMFIALLCIFADTGNKEETTLGREVLMQNDYGRLVISRDTLENLVNTVIKEFPGAKEAQTKIELDEKNNVAVYINLVVTKNVIIKELTLNMQNRIKEAISKTSDLDVNEVNVRIKNIVDSESEE